MTALLHDLLLALTIACAIPAALGLIEALLAWRSRRTTYRGLPHPDCVSERNRRALAAYRNNARAHSGLRERA